MTSERNRLFSLYQLAEYVLDDEIGEHDWPEGPFDPVTFFRFYRAVIDAARYDEDFECCLPTMEELAEAFRVGPTMCEEFAQIIHQAVDQWELEYPECKTFGELLESSRKAGRA